MRGGGLSDYSAADLRDKSTGRVCGGFYGGLFKKVRRGLCSVDRSQSTGGIPRKSTPHKVDLSQPQVISPRRTVFWWTFGLVGVRGP